MENAKHHPGSKEYEAFSSSTASFKTTIWKQLNGSWYGTTKLSDISAMKLISSLAVRENTRT